MASFQVIAHRRVCRAWGRACAPLPVLVRNESVADRHCQGMGEILRNAIGLMHDEVMRVALRFGGCVVMPADVLHRLERGNRPADPGRLLLVFKSLSAIQ